MHRGFEEKSLTYKIHRTSVNHSFTAFASLAALAFAKRLPQSLHEYGLAQGFPSPHEQLALSSAADPTICKWSCDSLSASPVRSDAIATVHALPLSSTKHGIFLQTPKMLCASPLAFRWDTRLRRRSPGGGEGGIESLDGVSVSTTGRPRRAGLPYILSPIVRDAHSPGR